MLIYLLGKPEVQLLDVTTTFGNSTVDVVYSITKNMLKDLGRADIPVLKGSSSKSNRTSEAAKFLVDQANQYPGRLKIVAVGAMTNLCAAYELDHDFFHKVKVNRADARSY